MTTPAQGLGERTRRLIALQCVIGVIVATAFFLAQTPLHALSAGFGAIISILSALWLSWGVARAGEEAGHARKKGEAILYVSAALRFLMVLALFAVALLALKLEALATVTGFVLAQLAFVASAGRRGGTT